MPLGPAAGRPAAAVLGAEALGALLVEADHNTVLGLLAVQREDPLRLRLVVGVGALLPAPRALQRDSVAGQDPAQLGGRDDQSLPAQVPGQLGKTPTRERHPEHVGTGAGDRDDPLLLVSRDPAGTPAPKTRAQRVPAMPIELMDHLPHMRLVGEQHPGDRRGAHQRVRREQDDRSLPRRCHLRPPRQPLQPLALIRTQLTHEHLRRTHPYLLRSDTPPFDTNTNGPATFQAKHSEKAH